MRSTLFPDFPHLYDPPADVVRQLRDVHPAVDLLYMGWGTWYLVRYNPNREHIATATRALIAGLRLLEQWRTGTEFRKNPGAFRRLYGRYLFWTAVRLGARPIAEYPRAHIRQFGFAAIVDDFRRMEWLLRNTSEGEALRMFNARHEDGVAVARSEVADEYKAATMASHLSKNPHSVTSAAPEIGRSGFARSTARSA